ncbi:MAG: hypothetical protein RIQ43_1296, partial [Pseudomonadota bacterium]
MTGGGIFRASVAMSVDDAAGDPRTAATERGRMIGVVVSAGMQHQRAAGKL